MGAPGDNSAIDHTHIGAQCDNRAIDHTHIGAQCDMERHRYIECEKTDTVMELY